MALSAFTLLWNSHYNPSPEFSPSQTDTLSTLNTNSSSPLISPSVHSNSMNLTILGTLYKWNQTNIFWYTSFLMQTTRKVILSTSFFFFFVKLFLLRAGKFAFSPVPSPTHVIPLYMKLEMLRCSFTKLCLTLHDLMNMSVPGSLSVTVSQSLLKLMPIESVMPSNHLTLCNHFSFCPVFPSIRVFSNE